MCRNFWSMCCDNIRRHQWGQSVGRNQDDRPTTGQWQAIALGCYLYASAWRFQMSRRRTVSRHSHSVLMLYIHSCPVGINGKQSHNIHQYRVTVRQGHQQPPFKILCNTQNNHLFRHNRRRRSMTTYAAAGDAGAFNMTCHCQHIHGALSISRGIFRQIVKHATK